MRVLASLFCLSLAFAAAAAATEKPHPRHAMVQQIPSPRAGCLDQGRLSAQHTAYTPSAADMMAPRCGRLLSTDTLIAARHWDQT
jgi:hypothetical protein